MSKVARNYRKAKNSMDQEGSEETSVDQVGTPVRKKGEGSQRTPAGQESTEDDDNVVDDQAFPPPRRGLPIPKEEGYAHVKISGEPNAENDFIWELPSAGMSKEFSIAANMVCKGPTSVGKIPLQHASQRYLAPVEIMGYLDIHGLKEDAETLQWSKARTRDAMFDCIQEVAAKVQLEAKMLRVLTNHLDALRDTSEKRVGTLEASDNSYETKVALMYKHLDGKLRDWVTTTLAEPDVRQMIMKGIEPKLTEKIKEEMKEEMVTEFETFVENFKQFISEWEDDRFKVVSQLQKQVETLPYQS